MHGRLKVKTTVQQQEEKEKERAKKLMLYNAGMSKAWEKRKKQNFDDEALEITSQLLLANPDIYSMWNFRKEVLQFKKSKVSSDFRAVMTNELSFTEYCLRINPKSYGSWNHRIWVLDEMPEPDWQKEVKLCNKYLELDERNFHCWSYRFFVARHAKITPEQELEFTDSKISSNFSNYSSWHYRSKLLPQIYPDPDKLRPIAEDKLLQEFELVQNAAFTDPNDQSAWFYHRWLLGRGDIPLELNSLYVNQNNSFILVFNKPVAADAVKKHIQLAVNGIIKDANWSRTSFSSEYDAVWTGKLAQGNVLINDSNDVEIKAVFQKEEGVSQLICNLRSGNNETWVWMPLRWKNFSMELSAATTSVLHQELESCLQLQELEPDSKWPLLTNILLMRSIDFNEYKNQIMENFEKIMNADHLRAMYYKDLKSKFIIENAVEHLQEHQSNLNLSGLSLTALYHPEYLIHVKELDLSGNCLHSFNGFEMLLHLETLNVDENAIRSCEGLQNLPNLKNLSMQGNAICTIDALQPLTHCRMLITLGLRRNPICSMTNCHSQVLTILPSLLELDQQIYHSGNFI